MLLDIPMCPPSIEEWNKSRKISILEVGMHKIGSKSPVGVFMYLYRVILHVSYTPHAKDLLPAF